jgi:hypothetical protein
MGGFSFENVQGYQRKMDILANVTPFRPGQFISANQDAILRLFDGQVEIAEVELKIWAYRHREDGPSELRCRVVGANPLTVKILDYDVDREQEVIKDKNHKKAEFRRKKSFERRNRT